MKSKIRWTLDNCPLCIDCVPKYYSASECDHSIIWEEFNEIKKTLQDKLQDAIVEASLLLESEHTKIKD